MQYLFGFNLKDIEMVHNDDFMKIIMKIVSVYRNNDLKYTTIEAMQLFEIAVECLRSYFHCSLAINSNDYWDVESDIDMGIYKDFKFGIDTINAENGEIEEKCCFSLIDYWGNDETVKIPNGVEKIDRHCFYCNKRIRTVYIPPTVKYISDKAFFDCANLEKIYTKSSFDSNIVNNCNKAEIVQLP